MKNKPDDRGDNVRKIQHNINHTIRNMEAADEMIERTDDNQTKRELSAKNERREAALDSMRSEIKDEADFQKKK